MVAHSLPFQLDDPIHASPLTASGPPPHPESGRLFTLGGWRIFQPRYGDFCTGADIIGRRNSRMH